MGTCLCRPATSASLYSNAITDAALESGDEADGGLGAAVRGLLGEPRGRVLFGRAADLADHDDLLGLVVVDGDLFAVEPARLGETKVVLTMVGGKVVFER